MNDPAAEWFYAQAGRQEGPVTLAELKAKAADGTLDPRHDLVWTQGMKDWKPAGEVDGVFERRVASDEPEKSTVTPAAVAAAPAAAVNPDPYAPPGTLAADGLLPHDMVWPGARRRTFILMTILFPLVWQFGISLGVPLLVSPDAAGMAFVALIGMLLVPFVVCIYFGLQRLANVGMSRWWYLGNLVPILNLWIGYRMLACPAGYAYHKKLDGPGTALAIVYWLLVGLVLLSFVAMTVAMFGLVSSPELQQQIERALQEMLESSSQ